MHFFGRSKLIQKITSSFVSVMMALSFVPGTVMADEGPMYQVNFGTASWTIEEVTVTAKVNGEDITDSPVTILETDEIELANYDDDLMEVKVSGPENFVATLSVGEDKTTSLGNAVGCDGLPVDGILVFEVTRRSGPGGEPGGEGQPGGEPGEQPGGEPGGEQNRTYDVDFGTASWTIGDVNVTAAIDDMTITSGAVNLKEDVQIKLTNFDEETMEVALVAEDGFTTKLSVNGGITTIADREAQNMPNGILTFKVQVKPNQGGDDNPPPPPQDEDVVRFQFDNHNGANGTVYVLFDTESEPITVKQNDLPSFSNIDIKIPEGAKSVKITVDPNDGASNGEYVLDIGASRVYVDDKNILNDEIYNKIISKDGYVQELTDNKVIFVISFGLPAVEWYTVSWAGGNVDVENGQVLVDSIVVGDKTYVNGLAKADESKKNYPITDISGKDNDGMLRDLGINLPMPDDVAKDENGYIIDLSDLFIRVDYNPGIVINYRFIPDYGYQVTDVKTNESDSLLDAFVPGVEVSTFAFEVKANQNVHFNVDFTSAKDVVEMNSKAVTEATIGNGNAAISSGNLKLTVDELTDKDVSKDVIAETNGNDAIYLSMDLYQEVSKGKADSNWEQQLTDLNGEIDVTLKVNDLDPDSEYMIVREHEVDGKVTIDTFPVSINAKDMTVTIKTDKFSTYALVKASKAPAEEPGGSDEPGIGDFITRCYNVALGRNPDQEGYKYWVDNLVNGKACGAQVGYGFIFSEEYTSQEKSNEDYVTDLYRMYFDREPDSEGFKYWVDMLNEGESREVVFAGFANSLEFFNLCLKYEVIQGAYLVGVPNDQQGGVNSFVSRLYAVCLDRIPDMNGQADWVSKLMNGEISGTECSFGFIFSPEFIKLELSNEEFVNRMYAAFFGREADEAGFNSWVEKLNNGASHEEVFKGFAGSPEFFLLCASYGINA